MVEGAKVWLTDSYFRHIFEVRCSASRNPRLSLVVSLQHYLINSCCLCRVPVCIEYMNRRIYWLVDAFETIYLWLYSPCGTWSLFQFLNLYTVSRTPWAGNRLVARPLPTHRRTNRINAHRHPCLEWNSNPRFQFSSWRRLLFLYCGKINYKINSTSSNLYECASERTAVKIFYSYVWGVSNHCYATTSNLT
jgi:hypothetical protein